MIWALMAILGVPLWLVAGGLIAVLTSRRSVRRQPGIFAVAVRPAGGTKWPRTVAYGRIVRSVFVLNRGPALLRTEVCAVDASEPIGLTDSPKRPADAVGRLLALADGRKVEIAVSAIDAHLVDAPPDGSCP